MSEQNGRGRRRAAAPVDAPTRSSGKDPALSPRRRARIAATASTQFPFDTSISQTELQPSTEETSLLELAAVEPGQGTYGLLTQWLQANGFESLEHFQGLARAADAQRTHSADSIFCNSVPSGETTTPPPNPQSTAASTSAAIASVTTNSVAATKVPPASVALRGLPPELDPGMIPTQVVTRKEILNPLPSITDSTVVSVKPDLTSTPSPVPDLRPKQVAQTRDSRRRLRRAQRPLSPQPLAKTRKVPVTLTAVVLVILVIILGILTFWYQSSLRQEPVADKSKIEVFGAIGAQPVVSLEDPLPLANSTVDRLQTGTGKAVTIGDIIVLRITVFSGYDGTLQSDIGDASVLVGKLSPEVLGTQIYEIVKQASEGSRYLLTQPVEQKDGTSRMEIGVIDVLSTSLSGQMQPLPADGSVSLTVNPDGSFQPQVNGEFSGKFTLHRLLDGKGATVGSGQTVLVRYAEYSYSNPPVLLKDHLADPVKVRLDTNLQSGVARGLVDQKIGSRLLLELPASEGTGTHPTILIVDILAAWDNPKASAT